MHGEGVDKCNENWIIVYDIFLVPIAITIFLCGELMYEYDRKRFCSALQPIRYPLFSYNA